MSALISVALCTYNGAKFIAQQLDSILAQSHKNLEIVIVDDSSTDNTYEILDNYSKKYPQIKIYFNDKNLGFNTNFQKAINLCTGNFIAISDQDDIWLPNKLEILLANIADNYLVFSNSSFIDESGQIIGGQILSPDFNLLGKDFKRFLFYNSVTGHTCMFHKSFIKHFMPIPHQGYYDWYMGFIAVYHNKAVCVNECLTLHRVHQKSVTFNSYKDDSKKVIRNEINTQLQIIKEYKGLSAQDRRLINKIATAYQKKNNIFLMSLITKYYDKYFPDRKRRNLLSKLNFALKFSKGI